MKKTINNALNEISDKYIEEAYNATGLQHTTARTIRNIAIPVASAAAIAGLCLGMSKLGVFKSGGVDLLPAESTNGAGDTSSITVNDPQYEYIGYTPSLPDNIPLVLQTTDHIESIVFGSQYPEMIYADENSAMFTDGISGLYIFDFDTEEIAFAADIYTTFDMALTDYPQKIGANYGGDSWNGIELFAGADGTPYCSMAYHSDIVLTGSGLPTQSQWQTKYYEIDTEALTLTALPSDDMTIPLYEGLKEIPYNENENYRNMSLNAAYIGDTDEFVYIRNCTTDIDLLPRYNMEYIELRRWTAEEVTGEPMEGGYYPFSDKVGKDVKLYSYYYTDDSVVGHECHGINFDGVKFTLDMHASVGRVPQGYYTLYGDIVCMTEETNGYQWLYRIEADTLQPLEALIEQPENIDLEQTYHGMPLIKQTDTLADDVLPLKYESLMKQIEMITETLSEDIDAMEARKAQLEEMYANVQEQLSSDKLTEEERIECYEMEAELTMAISYLETDHEELKALLANYQIEFAAIEAQMQKSGFFSHEVQDFLSTLDPRVAAAVKGFMEVEPSAEFWGTSSANISYGIVTAEAINMFNEHILSLDDGTAEMILSDDQLVYSMCLNSYWLDNDAAGTEDHDKEPEQLNELITDLILSRELSYSGSADMENMLYPLDPKYNYITSYFGYDAFRGGNHYGIDIADKGIGGADIYAVQDGLVIAANNNGGWSNGLGNYVVIDHGNGYCTLYAHCYEVYVAAGDSVKRGDTIAAVGTTGWSTGNHLHFEIRKDGVAIDPLSFPYGDVTPIKFDSFEAALKYAFENAGEPAIPDYIAQPIDCESGTGVCVYSDYSEYTSDTPNADVFAADAGEIIFANYTDEADKVCIAIMHDGYVTVYRGLSSYTYEAGEHVHMGWVIGKADDEGKIRFELRTDADVIMNTKDYCEKIDPAMNDFPQTGNAKAAFCDKILYSNEPSMLFDAKIKAYAVRANGVTTVLKNEDGSAEKYGNLFFNENESLLDVVYIGNGCLVTSRTAELADGSYIRKEYYLDGSYIDTILRYSVAADGTEVLIETIYVDYLMTDEDIAAYEYDPATCRPVSGTISNAITQALADAGEPVFPDSIAMPIGSNGNTVYSTVYDEYTEYSSYANADVLAAESGEIVFAGYTGDSYECCIIILHKGYVTVYRGLSDCKLAEGDFAERGATIGTSGEDGTIRFELHTESTDYDPGLCRPVTE